MLLFNPDQIEKIKLNIKKDVLVFVLENVGMLALTELDKKLLESSGIDLTKFGKEIPILEAAYKFGMAVNNSDPRIAKEISFHEFNQIIKSNKFLPLDKYEQASLNSLVFDTTGDVKRLADRVCNKLEAIISEKDKILKPKLEKIIQEKTKLAILKRQTVQEMASELYHESSSFITFDLVRISQYQLHSAFNQGIINQQISIEGYDNAKFWFYVYPQACPNCIEHYLTAGKDSRPIIFGADRLIENGSNIGRKVKDWQPTINSLHPYCRCELNSYINGWIWDEQTKTFNQPVLTNEQREKIKEENIELLKKRKLRSLGGPISKGIIQNKIQTDLKEIHQHNKIIISKYKAVNEYEKLFKERFGNSLGFSIENAIKLMVKMI